MSTRPILSLTTAALCLLSSLTQVQADSVKWRSSVDAAKVEAAQTGKLVLLHFWSTSCAPCKQLESNVFSQPQVGQLIEQHFVPVKISADTSPAFASLYNIDRVPTDVVLSPQGNVVAKLACPPDALGYSTQLLNLSQHYRQQIAKHNAPAQAPIQSAYAGLKVGQYNNAPIATAPVSAQPSAATPASQPQVTHNAYISAAANPQVPSQVVTAAPNRYGNPQVAATVPQAAPVQPATVQMTSSQTPMPPQQQIAVSPISAAVATVATASKMESKMESKTAATIKLPEGSPPLAFEGYCPSTLKHARKWVLGDLKYGAIHRGRTYLFTGETQRQQFLANPDAYSPVFSGIDPVKLLDENQTVEGSRKFGYEYRGAFYLFSSQATMDRFESQPDQYAAGVRQAMTRMDGLGTTLRR